MGILSVCGRESRGSLFDASALRYALARRNWALRPRVGRSPCWDPRAFVTMKTLLALRIESTGCWPAVSSEWGVLYLTPKNHTAAGMAVLRRERACRLSPFFSPLLL